MMKFLFVWLLVLCNVAYGASYEQNFRGLPAQAYVDAGSFPTLAPDGTLAVNKDTNELYVYDVDTPGWLLISAGGGGGGTVNDVTASSPLASTGGTNPNISIQQASGSQNGYLGSADWTTFNNKEGAITAGTSAQYWRGDKTFQTLDTSVVPENTNLYWTNGRFDTRFGTKSTTDLAEGTNLYYTQGRFDTAFAAKSTTDLAEGTNLYYTQGRFDTAFGAKDTDDLAEGTTNLYHTDTRARTAAVADAINNGTTNIAPSQNAVFDALALKSDTGHTHVAADVTDFTAAAKTAVVDDAITDGVTDKAPSQNAVFDALALKANATSVWSLSGNNGTGGTGKVGTTDAQNWDIIAGNGTVATIVNSYKGISAAPTVVPADATNVIQFDWRAYVSPSASTTGANHTTSYSELNWDNPSADFGNASGSLIANNNLFVKSGSGTVNYASALSSSGNINEGTVTQYKGLTNEGGIASGATASDYYGVVSGLNTTGGILGSYTGYSQYANFTDSPLSQTAQGVVSSLSFSGTSALSQGVNGFNSYLQFNDTAAVTNAVYGFNSGIDLNNSANLNGLYGINSYFNLRDTSDAGLVYGLNLGLTQEDAAVSSGTNAINVNYTFGGSGTAGDVNLANFYGRTLDTVDLNSFTGINLNPELEGSSVVDSATMVSVGGQFRGSATFQNLNGMTLNPQLSGSASADNFTGLTVSPSITGSSTLTNGLTAVSVNPTASNTGGISAATGLNVNMSGVTLSSAAIAAGEKVKALAFDGAVEGNSSYTVPGALSYFQNHYIGGTVGVAAADPIAAFGFGINLAQTVNFQDDWTADGSGLGFVNTGFVGAIQGATGKTMYSWTGALGGAGNSAGAGTLTNAKMFSAAGILPQGGSLAVTNMYGFEVNPNTFCVIGTNCWGFYEDTAAAENHMSKLAIGTSSKKVANSSTALEIGSTKGFVNGRVTTAQRTALTGVDGMQVYDTDLDAIYVYAAGSWVAVGSGTFGTEAQEVPTGTIDNSNVTFNLANTPVSNASVKLYKNGTFLRQGTDYTISSGTITMTVAPNFAETLDAVYRY